MWKSSKTLKRVFSRHVFEQDLVICKVYFCIETNNQWHFQLGNKTFDSTSEVLNLIPTSITNENMEQFNTFLKDLQICDGLRGYSDVIQSRLDIKLPFLSETGDQTGMLNGCVE